jgi:hypothetical protein
MDRQEADKTSDKGMASQIRVRAKIDSKAPILRQIELKKQMPH